MKNASIGQRVWAEKLARTFVVVAIDESRKVADIQSTNSTDSIEKHVPLGMLHALRWDLGPTSRDWITPLR